MQRQVQDGRRALEREEVGTRELDKYLAVIAEDSFRVCLALRIALKGSGVKNWRGGAPGKAREKALGT